MTEATPGPAAEPAPPRTDELIPSRPRGCLDYRCEEPAVAECGYVDHETNCCATWWCEAHSAVVDGTPYCLRHAVLVSALQTERGGLFNRPGVRNRAASLVAWVCRDLDEGVRVLVGGAFGDGASVSSEDLQPLDDLDAGGQSWYSGWRINLDGAAPLVIGLEVAERKDDELLISVGAEVSDRSVPPWIRNRQRGVEVSFREDAVLRAEYYRSLLGAIARAIGDALGRPPLPLPAINYAPRDRSS